MSSSFQIAVEIWNEPLPSSRIHPILFPAPFSTPNQPSSQEAAHCLANDINPQSLWAAQERGNASFELRECNLSDLAALRRDRLQEVKSAFSREFQSSPEINQRVVCSTKFWLARHHVSAVTVSANEAL